MKYMNLILCIDNNINLLLLFSFLFIYCLIICYSNYLLFNCKNNEYYLLLFI
jgi:hypothetical protein